MGRVRKARQRGQIGLRWLSVAVLVLLVAAAGTGAWMTRSVVREQEDRLLRDRTREFANLVTASTNSLASSLKLLAAVYRPDSPALFNSIAGSIVKDDVVTVGLAVQRNDQFVPVAVAGQGATGTPLAGALADTARRSLTAAGLVSFVGQQGTRTYLVRAVATGAAVMYYEATLHPTQPYFSSPKSLTSELNAVVYASPHPDTDRVVLSTTGEAQLTGKAQRRTVEVGADRWTLATTRKGSLVGSFAPKVPSLILGTGILIALAGATVVEVLTRRRAYALRLVGERTSALQRAYDELHSSRDIIDKSRKVAEDANQSKSEFLSRMSHELRTPLNAVLGFSQLLEASDLTEDQHESVEQIAKGGMHLLALINEVLDISRIETGDLALSPESILVNQVVRDSIALVRPLADQHRVHILVSDDIDRQYVFADAQRLKQILLNLLSNAIKYNLAGGSVKVAIEDRPDDRVRILVADTGRGISDAQRGRLFVPFERLGAEQTGIEGTGIGLALSQRLAVALGGELDFTSIPGEGSTFWIELPNAEGPVERHERLNTFDIAVPTRDWNGHKPMVLHVEDNLVNVRLMERVFAARRDLELTHAMQGRLGLDLARQHSPALILLDLHLPDMTGEQVLQELQDDPETAAIPVIVISADATRGQEERLIAAGAAGYLTKPFDVQLLHHTIDEVLEHSLLVSAETAL